MSDLEPRQYLFKVPKSVSEPLNRYPKNKAVFTAIGTCAWNAIVIPIFIMDVFDLNLHIALGVVFILAQFPILYFCVPAFLLNPPARKLAEIVVRASGKKLLFQDVFHALKKAPWERTGQRIASGTGPTMKDGIWVLSRGDEWLIRMSPSLSSGRVTWVDPLDLVTDSTVTTDQSSREKNDIVMILPKDILKRRNTAIMQLLLLVGVSFACGIALSLIQSYVSISLGIIATGFVVIGMTKLLKKPLTSDSNREIAEFIATSLNQSKRFENALFLSLSNGTFTRITQSGFGGMNQSVHYLEVPIIPANEPTWMISALEDSKGFRLRLTDRVAVRGHR